MQRQNPRHIDLGHHVAKAQVFLILRKCCHPCADRTVDLRRIIAPPGKIIGKICDIADTRDRYTVSCDGKPTNKLIEIPAEPRNFSIFSLYGGSLTADSSAGKNNFSRYKIGTVISADQRDIGTDCQDFVYFICKGKSDRVRKCRNGLDFHGDVLPFCIFNNISIPKFPRKCKIYSMD